ncbi:MULTISPECIES: ABC transporter permease [Kosmotoga]|uniref:Inner-membrane translocator n=1 Tax=Kosmotoga olearia (strain ATCC BAA-1733 / DSM 21960 / TBF 19.5.1) TaxID=521045 RepID=C5CGD5_KOSOT|nr:MULTISPECIES: ABC transporter permease [Kosmotoga]ACR80516.1 inner-membrane translocator [Kosmotoga olearia TBF 19.5.1]MDI3523353.1 riboflavin transport system permease protein [Kosmotoga sp.]MDK2953575.1 riboflavin transport system permease protein [Kosmotoga sp.]
MTEFLHGFIITGTPILFAALGGLFTELSGALNIGIEGMMLLSAFFSFMMTYISERLLIGTLSAVASAISLGFLTIFLTEKLKANLFIVGLATNIFASGLTVFLSVEIFHSKGTIAPLNIPKLGQISFGILDKFGPLGEIFNNLNILNYLAIISIPIVYFLVHKTKIGLRIQAVGMNEETAYASGINIVRTRLIAYTIAGIFFGLAGASLSLPLGAFVGNMTAGRGWIALVAVFLGRGKPLPVVTASIIMIGATELSNVLQVITTFSPKLLLTIPYIVTFISVALFSASTKKSR